MAVRRTFDHQAGRDPPEPDRQDQLPVRGKGLHRRPEAYLDDRQQATDSSTACTRPVRSSTTFALSEPRAPWSCRFSRRRTPLRTTADHGRHQPGQCRRQHDPQGLRRVDQANSVHGSGLAGNSAIEIAYFFASSRRSSAEAGLLKTKSGHWAALLTYRRASTQDSKADQERSNRQRLGSRPRILGRQPGPAPSRPAAERSEDVRSTNC